MAKKVAAYQALGGGNLEKNSGNNGSKYRSRTNRDHSTGSYADIGHSREEAKLTYQKENCTDEK
ncbi:hypothetical protein TURTL08_04950 [Turicimonas sp. TL08]